MYQVPAPPCPSEQPHHCNPGPSCKGQEATPATVHPLRQHASCNYSQPGTLTGRAARSLLPATRRELAGLGHSLSPRRHGDTECHKLRGHCLPCTLGAPGTVRPASTAWWRQQRDRGCAWDAGMTPVGHCRDTGHCHSRDRAARPSLAKHCQLRTAKAPPIRRCRDAGAPHITHPALHVGRCPLPTAPQEPGQCPARGLSDAAPLPTPHTALEPPRGAAAPHSPCTPRRSAQHLPAAARSLGNPAPCASPKTSPALAAGALLLPLAARSRLGCCPRTVGCPRVLVPTLPTAETAPEALPPCIADAHCTLHCRRPATGNLLPVCQSCRGSASPTGTAPLCAEPHASVLCVATSFPAPCFPGWDQAHQPHCVPQNQNLQHLPRPHGCDPFSPLPLLLSARCTQPAGWVGAPLASPLCGATRLLPSSAPSSCSPQRRADPQQVEHLAPSALVPASCQPAAHSPSVPALAHGQAAAGMEVGSSSLGRREGSSASGDGAMAPKPSSALLPHPTNILPAREQTFPPCLGHAQPPGGMSRVEGRRESSCPHPARGQGWR